MGKDQFGSSDKSRRIPAKKIKKAKKQPGTAKPAKMIEVIAVGLFIGLPSAVFLAVIAFFIEAQKGGIQ